MPDQKNSPENAEISLGVNLPLFSKGVETLAQLGRERSFNIYLLRDYWVKFIGDKDKYTISLAKEANQESLTRKIVGELLNEVRVILQVYLATKDIKYAADLLKDSLFEDEFEAAKENKKTIELYEKIVNEKLTMVYNSLVTPTLIQRQNRLSNNNNIVLEDLDVEVVESRYVSGEKINSNVPYLRVNFKYINPAKAALAFNPPPWYSFEKGIKSDIFALECDENEIDLIILRLNQAKELLAKALKDSLGESLEEVK